MFPTVFPTADAIKSKQLYVLADDKGHYYCAAFSQPSCDHAMWCTTDLFQATTFASEDAAQEFMDATAVRAVSQTELVIRKEFLALCKPVLVTRTISLTLQKAGTARSA